MHTALAISMVAHGVYGSMIHAIVSIVIDLRCRAVGSEVIEKRSHYTETSI